MAIPVGAAPVTCEECMGRLTETKYGTTHDVFEVTGPVLYVADGHAYFQSVVHDDEPDEGVLPLCTAWPWGS